MPVSVARSSASSGRLFLEDALIIRTVLVVLGPVPSPDNALHYAPALADRFGAKLHFVRAFERRHSSSQACASAAAGTRNGARSYAIDLPPGELHDLNGNDSHKICALAAELKANMIVATAHRHVGLKERFFGSTAERMVPHAPCPLLVIPEDAGECTSTRASVQFKKIVVPVDFSDSAMSGLEYALRFAPVWDAEIFLVNCVSAQTLAIYGEYGGRAVSLMGVKEEMERLVQKLEARGFPVAGAAELEAPVEKICDYAHEHDADLVIASTHGRMGLKDALVGSTAEHLVRAARCPVLIVPSRSAKA